MPTAPRPNHPADLTAAQLRTVRRAQRIAVSVDAVWAGRHSSGVELQIPIAVVAALALCQQADPSGPDPVPQLAGLDQDTLLKVLRWVWATFTAARPDLAVRTEPLREWLTDPSEWQADGAHAVAQAALHSGILQLLADPGRRHNVDLLGQVLQTLRNHATKAVRGEFHTPAGLATLTAEGLVAALTRHPEDQPETMYEPAAGTGVMVCAAAQLIRHQGNDPTACTWYVNDIDPLAAACLAVNAHLWDLGRRVLVGCGDGLDDSWVTAAIRDRHAGIVAQRLGNAERPDTGQSVAA